MKCSAPPLTGLLVHERYFWHDPGSGAGFSSTNAYMQPDHHPEAPETKRRLLGLLEVSGLADQLVRLKPRPAERHELRYFHTDRYIDAVRELSAANGGSVGESVSIGPGSYEIAELAAGGCIAATDAVLAGRVKNAYALVRPPGHHAEADRGRGYCVFGNAVLLIRHAQRVHPCSASPSSIGTCIMATAPKPHSSRIPRYSLCRSTKTAVIRSIRET